jgi:hypothetical protein
MYDHPCAVDSGIEEILEHAMTAFDPTQSEPLVQSLLCRR